MRQLFRNQYRHRSNLILLKYGRNNHKYTFLEGQYFNRLQRQAQVNKQQQNSQQLVNSPLIISQLCKNKYKNNMRAGNLIQKLNRYKQPLMQIQSIDFGQIDLRGIGNKIEDNGLDSNINNRFKEHRQILKQISNQYDEMQNNIYRSLSRQNLAQNILTLTQYNCIDIKIWQKIISYTCAYYKQQDLQNRLIYMTGISEYLKKFDYTYNLSKKPTFKFMFPQNYIVDLVDFRSLFKSIQNKNDYISLQDKQQDEQKKLLLLQNQIFMIMKATKKADMNIYIVRQYFQRRQQQMIRIVSRYKQSPTHKRLIYNIYFIYSYLNYNNSKLFTQIQKYYYQYLKQLMEENLLIKNPALSVSNKSRQINKILSIWKLNQRPNLNIYHQFIKPFLQFIIHHNLQKNYYSNIAINLLMAGIKDHSIINQFVQQCDQQSSIKQDQFTHMLKHYLNIVHNDTSYQSSFPKCQNIQNPKITKYLNDHKKNIFSSCLQHSTQLSQKRKKQRNIQHHRVERIWSQIVRKVFQHKYEVIENASICNYELDFLILTKKGMIALQISGGHYNRKTFNKDQNREDDDEEVRTTGKKQMRQVILKGYDIRFVNIHCEQKLPTYIMQSKNVQLGIKYINERIKQQMGCQVVNL